MGQPATPETTVKPSQSEEPGIEKGYEVEERIDVKNLATWQPYADDNIAWGASLKDPRVLKK
jgi:hypothetical protein